jgi:DNA-binding MarR family transcriptional regulator
MSEQERQRPIGFWLKRADELLTKRIDDAQRSSGLTRLDWQALNVVRERGSASAEEVAAVLQSFADRQRVYETLSHLARRGAIVQSADARWSLTEAGTSQYEGALAVQQQIRQRALTGITDAEYATAVSVLKRLVDNLEAEGPRHQVQGASQD